MLTCHRNARQRLRNAFFARTIRILLLRHPDALPPLPTCPASDRNTHTLWIRRPVHALASCFGLCGSCRYESYILELSYTQTGHGWRGCWCCLCGLLVWLHDVSQKSWVGGLDAGDVDCKDVACQGSGRAGGFGRFWMGKMGGKEAEAGLQISGKEDEVSKALRLLMR